MGHMNTQSHTSIKLALAAIAATLTLGACSLPWPPPPHAGHPAQAKIATNRAQWSAKMPAHYSFEAEMMCFCPETIRKAVVFEVKDGATVAMRYADGGEISAETKDVFLQHSSIDKMFAILQDAADRKASSINVTYDAALGFPTEIAIDYDTMMADEERSFLIRNVKAL